MLRTDTGSGEKRTFPDSISDLTPISEIAISSGCFTEKSLPQRMKKSVVCLVDAYREYSICLAHITKNGNAHSATRIHFYGSRSGTGLGDLLDLGPGN